jgi:hypothetical protein
MIAEKRNISIRKFKRRARGKREEEMNENKTKFGFICKSGT